MAKIHPTATVHPGAQLGENVEVGPYAIINEDVIIGENCRIAARAYIDDGARLADNVEVGIGAVLSTAPQDLKYKGEKTYLEVGEGTRIREYATLNRGTDYHFKTVVGRNCYLMAYSHVAHDCILGDNVILSNSVNMAGHVVIESHVGIGGLSAIHQFVRIGQHSFIGGGYRIPKDVPPYILAMGEPLQYGGVNRVGLLRKGFSEELISQIKRAYRFIFRSNLTRREAIAKIRSEFPMSPEIENILQFVEHSERGLIRGKAAE